jgi:hypothetical protein
MFGKVMQYIKLILRYQYLLGKDFKATYGEEFYKMLNDQGKHGGFQYQDGLNIDTVPFNPFGSCQKGGLYFTLKEHIPSFLDYGTTIATIEIPDDALIYIDPEGCKFKADRFIIIKQQHISEWDMWSNGDYCLIAVDQNGSSLQYVKEQTLEICLAAVANYGPALLHVKEQTPEICLAAVSQQLSGLRHGYSLRYVKEQTPEICLAAVSENGCALAYVTEQTPEICLAAVSATGYALEYVTEQTPEICLAAVSQNGFALRYVKEQTLEICLTAVLEYGFTLQYVKEQHQESVKRLICRVLDIITTPSLSCCLATSAQTDLHSPNI